MILRTMRLRTKNHAAVNIADIEIFRNMGKKDCKSYKWFILSNLPGGKFRHNSSSLNHFQNIC